MNVVHLIGRVARFPELRKTANGKSYMNLVLAIDGYYDRTKGETTTDFIPILLWGKLAERAHHLMKGSLVAITGRVAISSYEDKNGNKKWSMEIVGEDIEFLAKPKNRENGQ